MSLYQSSLTIDGIPCAMVLRGVQNGQYLAVFERSAAELPRIETIHWDKPLISGDCLLPAGYGFTLADVAYSAATRSYTLTLQVAQQYLGDVTAYQEQVEQLSQQVQEQQAAIEEKDAALQAQEETIQNQEETIQALEADSATQLKQELQQAYTEGVEENG